MATPLVERIFQRADSLDLSTRLPLLTGLAPERITDLRGGSPLSSTEYERLCRALAVDPHAFYAGEEARSNRALVRFRSAMDEDLSRPTDLRMLALAAETGRVLGQLWSRLERPMPLENLRAFKAVDAGEGWREGYTLGEEARARLDWPTGPVADLEDRLGHVGVHVVAITLGSPNIDAACVWEPGALPMILLNQAAPSLAHPGARRSALAHELAHLLHDAGEGDLVTRISRSDARGSYSEATEVRARAFAPAFLAPPAQVKAWNQTLRPSLNHRERIRRLAETWGLSYEGAAWHAKNVGIVPVHDAESQARSPRKPVVDLAAFEPGPTTTPPVMLHPELPEYAAPLWDGLATRIVVAAMEEGLISLGRARELLTWA